MTQIDLDVLKKIYEYQEYSYDENCDIFNSNIEKTDITEDMKEADRFLRMTNKRTPLNELKYNIRKEIMSFCVGSDENLNDNYVNSEYLIKSDLVNLIDFRIFNAQDEIIDKNKNTIATYYANQLVKFCERKKDITFCEKLDCKISLCLYLLIILDIDFEKKNIYNVSATDILSKNDEAMDIYNFIKSGYHVF